MVVEINNNLDSAALLTTRLGAFGSCRDFASMVDSSTVRTQAVEYHAVDDAGELTLVAACLADVMADGVSLVYISLNATAATSSFNPAGTRSS